MNWFIFILLAILGVAQFLPLSDRAKLYAGGVFLVLMVIWVVFGTGLIPPLR